MRHLFTQLLAAPVDELGVLDVAAILAS